MAITDFQGRTAGHSAVAWERAGRELAQFWRDLRSRAPRHSLPILVGAAAAISLIGAALSFTPPAFEIAAPTAKLPANCEQQAWPHLDDTCLRRENASQSDRKVRVISLDRDAPTSVPLPEATKGAPKAAKTAPKGPPGGWAKERPPR